MIKLIVSDIDGTILNAGESKVSPEILEAFDKLSKSGIKLCFASGRSDKSMKSILGQFSDTAFFISSDGACMTSAGKVLYTRPISISDILKITRADIYRSLTLTVTTPTENYIISGTHSALKESRGDTSTESFKATDSLYSIKEQIIKVSVFSESFTPKPLLNLPPSLRVCYNSNGWCEYVSAICNKGLAVSDLQMRLFMSKLDTACFGDGENDADMMKKACISVSVNNSAKILDTVCSFHTDDIAKTLLQIARKGSI